MFILKKFIKSASSRSSGHVFLGRLLGALCFLPLSCFAFPSQRYEVYELPRVNRWAYGTPTSVNDFGYVATNFSWNFTSPTQGEVVGLRGRVSKITPRGYDRVSSIIVSNKNQIMGWAEKFQGQGCLFFRTDKSSVCQSSSVESLSFVGINGAFTAIGYYTPLGGGEPRSCIIDKEGIRTFGAPPGARAFYPMSINSNGKVLGLAWMDEEEGYGVFYWRSGVFEDTGIYPLDTFTSAIHGPDGDIVLNLTEGDISVSYLFSNGRVTELDSLPVESDYSAPWTVSSGVSNSGDIVGLSNGAAFIRKGDTTYPIESLLTYPYSLLYSCGADYYPLVSPAGVITCNADVTPRNRSDNAGLLLVPVVMGDLDGDGRLRRDTRDLRQIQKCLKTSSQGRAYARICGRGDFDSDGVVDSSDYAEYLRISGF